MRRFFDLSFQHKIPLWGAGLIIISALSVSVTLMYQGYNDLKATLITSAGSLGSTLAHTLVPPLLHDDIWRGFEIVSAPFVAGGSANPVQPEVAMVVTMEDKIFVSSDPDRYPMLTKLASIDSDYALLSDAIAPNHIDPLVVVEPDASSRLFVATPMIDGGSRFGTLVLVYSNASLNRMFMRSALSGALLGLVVLAVLLPINWYWGQRMATPLVRLAQRMDDIQDQVPEHLEPELYVYQDELGRLFGAYNRMVEALREKNRLERGMLSAERLAAVGRLTAGIAHEINNPLAGMLTAIDTLKQRDDLDPRTLRTLGLVERGLCQVRDTVAALLVEARQQRRNLERRDLDDVKRLIQPTAAKQGVQLQIDLQMPDCVPIPAGPVRQVLINLLNNAVQGSNQGGQVECQVTAGRQELKIDVINHGAPILPAQMEHLFEPFVSFREGGTGLGLWVTYQLVSQMAGRIEVNCVQQTIHFTVTVPIGNEGIEAA